MLESKGFGGVPANQEQPLPPCHTTDTPHVQAEPLSATGVYKRENLVLQRRHSHSISDEAGASAGTKVAEKVDGESLGRLTALVPASESEKASGDETGLTESKKQTGDKERSKALLEGLECGDKTPSKACVSLG